MAIESTRLVLALVLVLALALASALKSEPPNTVILLSNYYCRAHLSDILFKNNNLV